MIYLLIISACFACLFCYKIGYNIGENKALKSLTLSKKYVSPELSSCRLEAEMFCDTYEEKGACDSKCRNFKLK